MNFSDTILTSSIWQASRDFEDLNQRLQEYGAVKLMLDNQRNFPLIQRLAKNGQKPTSIKLNDFNPTTAGTSISCSPTATSGDSTDTALVWQTISNSVTISQKRATNNLYTVQEMADIDFKNAITGMHDALETAIVNFINTNRSGYSIAQAGLSTWVSAGSANYNSIALERKDHIRSSIESEMKNQKYRGIKNLLISAPYDEFLTHTAIQGSSNAENFEDQLRGFKTYYTQENSTVASTYGGIFAIPVGGIMMFIHVDPSYNGISTNAGVWKRTKDPRFGFDLGMLTKNDCADTTAIGGGPQDNVSVTEFHFEVAFAIPSVSSPALETVIHKYALATS
ncbi:MAG: hypothetical protein GY849_02340 [Deltaproteobacteria bacterium]|nr:hypothetical protein [Deltaproteobacteria bacterium]